MKLTLKQIAEWVGGELSSHPDLEVAAPKTIADAGPHDFTFIEGPANAKKWPTCKAAAAIVDHAFIQVDDRPVIRVSEPQSAFIQVLLKLKPVRTEPTGVHPTAIIHPTAVLGEGILVGPYAQIGEGTKIGARGKIFAGAIVGRDCTIGDDVVLHPYCVLYDSCSLGHRVIIHANAVIGADGFGYRTIEGKHVRIPQLGNVEIADDVEIGACTTIDRGAVGPTRIGEGTKIDNLVMIGHNCQIGAHNIFAGQVGIAGSVVTEEYVVLAGQCGVADHLSIGKGAILCAQSGVQSNIGPGEKLIGSPTMPVSEYFRIISNSKRLTEMRKDIERLKKHTGLKDDK